jgi:hypothetical protein
VNIIAKVRRSLKRSSRRGTLADFLSLQQSLASAGADTLAARAMSMTLFGSLGQSMEVDLRGRVSVVLLHPGYVRTEASPLRENRARLTASRCCAACARWLRSRPNSVRAAPYSATRPVQSFRPSKWPKTACEGLSRFSGLRPGPCGLLVPAQDGCGVGRGPHRGG